MMLEKVRRRLNAVLDFAVEHGAIVGNPLPAVRRGRKAERRHYPAVTDLPGLGEVLRQACAASVECPESQLQYRLPRGYSAEYY